MAASPAACLVSDWLAGASFTPGGAQPQLDFSYNNVGSGTQRTYLVLEGITGASANLQAALVPIPTGDRCENATPIASGTTLPALTTAGFAHDYDYSPGGNHCINYWDDPDRVFAFTVPAGYRAVTSSDDADINLFASAACQAEITACLASGTQDPGNGPVTWINNTGAPATVMASASSDRPTFSFSYSAVPVPVGDLCGNPLPITPGTYSHSLVGYYPDRSLPFTAGCPGSSLNDRFYRVTVPAGQKLDVSLTKASPQQDARLALLASAPFICGSSATQCLDGDLIYFGATTSTAHAQWSNRGPTAYDVLIAVGTTASAPEAILTDYVLSVSLSSVSQAAAGDICETAPLITAGTLTAQSIAGYTYDYNWGGPNHLNGDCVTANGPDRAYAIDLPTGKRLTARVKPALGAFAVLNMVQGPAPHCNEHTMCLSGTGPDEDWTLVNDTGITHRIFLVVFSNGPFDLVTSIQ